MTTPPAAPQPPVCICGGRSSERVPNPRCPVHYPAPQPRDAERLADEYIGRADGAGRLARATKAEITSLRAELSDTQQREKRLLGYYETHDEYHRNYVCEHGNGVEKQVELVRQLRAELSTALADRNWLGGKVKEMNASLGKTSAEANALPTKNGAVLPPPIEPHAEARWQKSLATWENEPNRAAIMAIQFAWIEGAAAERARTPVPEASGEDVELARDLAAKIGYAAQADRDFDKAAALALAALTTARHAGAEAMRERAAIEADEDARMGEDDLDDPELEGVAGIRILAAKRIAAAIRALPTDTGASGEDGMTERYQYDPDGNAYSQGRRDGHAAGFTEALEMAAKVADSFTCGGCGMDGKSGAAIRALAPATTSR